jgi:hypothetical protein
MPSLYPQVSDSAAVDDDAPVQNHSSLENNNYNKTGTIKSSSGAKKAAFEGNGEIETSRSCHDWPFLILFILFWGGMVYIAYLAGTTGDLNRYLIMYKNSVDVRNYNQ